MVFPDPCKPTTKILIGGTAFKLSSFFSSPRTFTNSSKTILTIICPGVTDFKTSCPTILGLILLINSLATERETSDSNKACLILRNPSSACFSSSRVIRLKNEKALSILFVKFSNIIFFLSPNKKGTSGRILAD